MKKIIKKAFVAFRGDAILRQLNRQPRILYWHGVDSISDPVVEAEQFSVSEFEAQVQYLRRHYEIISMDEFRKRHVSGLFNGREVVLTFDDGYRNNLTVVAPILKRYEIPFTVFISTHNITTGELFPTSLIRLIVHGSGLGRVSVPKLGIAPEIITAEQRIEVQKHLSDYVKRHGSPEDVRELCRGLISSNFTNEQFLALRAKYPSLEPMSWDDVRALRSMGAQVGSHCVDHICCHGGQIEDEVKRQISESRHVIEKQIGAECSYFAYPNGDFTEFSNRCVSDSGYSMGFTTEPDAIGRPDESEAAIPRIAVPRNIDTFRILINLYPKKR